jgi:glycerol-3-phosphate dehydrogenase
MPRPVSLRETNLTRLDDGPFDVLIVGGGINGCVSAAALAGRGVRTALVERRDFASGTSQESSNLAWGGIKYLESLEFSLVRELCLSRNRLIRSYPSTVQEIRFFTTIQRRFRWHPVVLFAGAWLYWLMGNGYTRRPRFLTPDRIRQDEPLVETSSVVGGFEYSDAYLHDNDARFVFNFIRRAVTSGCIAANYVEALGSRRERDGWSTRVRDVIRGRELDVRSRLLVNAAGPDVDTLNRISGQATEHRHLFSKGIHLVVDRVTPNHRALAFFASDGRLFFVIPMGARTCIGTTDTRVDTPHVRVTAEDREFVLRNVNRLLDLPRPLTSADVIAERCGVRPLVVRGDDPGLGDWTQLSRRHIVEVDGERGHLSIFGGKLTDCLNVGDEVCEITESLGVTLPYPDYRWYGEPPDEVRREFFHQARLMDLDGYTSASASEQLSVRLWRRYGAHALQLLEQIREDPRDAEILIEGTEYIRCEIEQAARREMIVKLEDFLRRRSKIAQIARTDTIRRSPGLMEACRVLFGDEARERFDEYFQGKRADDHGRGAE